MHALRSTATVFPSGPRPGCRSAVRPRSYPEQRQRDLYVFNASGREDSSSEAEDEESPSATSIGGAIATLVFGAALLSERLNGIGIVQNLELHDKGAHPLLVGSIAGLLAAAAWPERQAAGRAPGFVGLLQLSLSRLAYVGLAGAIAAEMYTGKGILCLLDVETGVEALSDVEAVVAFLVMILLTAPGRKLAK